MNERFERAVSGLYPGTYNDKVRGWLTERYGEEEARSIWERTKENYLRYLDDLPEMGGKKNGHASAIYGGLLIFALYPALPDQPPIAEMQEFVQGLFMEPFTKLGKVFDLNRSRDMRLINMVFRSVGKRDRKDIKKYPDGFVNVSEPYDKEHHAARYHFTQCPNAEFAKKHGLLHVLPLMCNCDFFGIGEIHGQLIRRGTCGNAALCDYLVVGSENPVAKEYETVTDEGGFLISRRAGKQGEEIT
ncbi:MAG: L-2-amino-thiazoline-4-carboxylic acid hydrolase [Oscillospiraceae bacterium]|nr:L-2-amino-thiazoline-4-carboxylic acid hydrolase [Oscillospiraceae bacterium]